MQALVIDRQSRNADDFVSTSKEGIKMRRRDFIGISAATAMLPMLGRAATLAALQQPELSAAAYHSTRKFMPTRFGKIAYIERGTGRAALFLHGFPLNSFQWRGVLNPLSALRRCIAPDFLALGYTEVAPGQDVGPDSQVAMLAEFLDKLGILDVDLVANDSGLAVAQLFLVRHPQRVRSLLVTNGDTEIESPPEALKPVIEMSYAGTFVDRALAPSLANKALARTPQGLGGQCYANPENPTDEAIEYYLRPFVSSQRRKYLFHAYGVAQERNSLDGMEAALRRATVPVRIVWGYSDTIFSHAGADYLHSILKNSRGIRRLEESKLFWPEERPDVIIEEARALWAAA